MRNHDDLFWLKDVRNHDGPRVLLEDSEVVSFVGVRVGVVHGIVSPRGGWKDGGPKKSPEEFISAVRQLRGVDIFAMHEFSLPGWFSYEEFSVASRVAGSLCSRQSLGLFCAVM